MSMFPKDKFFIIAGPCVIESLQLLETVATSLKMLAQKLDIHVIFKSSFDKANRSSTSGFRGPGQAKGLAMLNTIKQKFSLPVLSDIHTPAMIAEAAKVLDVLQIPAFLARQSDLYIEAAKTGKALNIKKGQFMAPAEMQQALEKFRSAGSLAPVALTERGSFFGYGDLVVDFRSIDIMKETGAAYIFDATHSMQKPAALKNKSGGDRKYLRSLALAQVAAGAHGVFIEVHPHPHAAKSDAATQLPLADLEPLVKDMLKVYACVH